FGIPMGLHTTTVSTRNPASGKAAQAKAATAGLGGKGAAGAASPGDLRGVRNVPSDLQDLRTLTGIRDVRPLGEFEEWFEALVRRSKQAHGLAFWHRYVDDKDKVRETRTDHNFAFKQKLEKLARGVRKGFTLE